MQSPTDDPTAETHAVTALQTQTVIRACVAFYHREGTALLELREPGSMVVGRSLPADLIIGEPSLSRTHARFTWADGVLTVTDLQSKHGTLIAGRRVSEARLQAGDELTLGMVTASVHILTVPDLMKLGVESYERMTRRLREEVLRAHEFRRPLALMLVRSLREGSSHVGRFLDTLTGELRAVDAIGIYDDRTAMLLLPELDASAAYAMASRIFERHRELALVAGIAAYPDAASSDEALLAGCRRACLLATLERPLMVVPTAREAHAPTAADAVVVRDPKMLAVYRNARQVAPRGLPVLIRGETGVGKEIVAADLHRASGRLGPLKVINCATIPQQLTESLLFGHERGAFTGAAQRAAGLFEEANGGTVFLDEVGELSASAQAALLRVLQDKRIMRVGATREIEVDVRVIAATHRDLEAMVRDKLFREDLLYRINAVTLEVPPLRERVCEIAELARAFLGSAIAEWGGSARVFSPQVIALLEGYAWPGNVRQLRNVVERAAALCERNVIEAIDLPSSLRMDVSEPFAALGSSLPPEGAAGAEANNAEAAFKDRVRAFEATLISDALAQTRGSITRAATLLNMPVRTLTFKMKAYDLKSK